VLLLPTKKFNFDDYWAQAIYRKNYHDHDVLFAYVRRKHGYDDVNMEGEGKWIGVVDKPIYHMIVDKDEHSETYGQRIPQGDLIEFQDGHTENRKRLKGTAYEYIYKADTKTLADFKKLYDTTIHGTTNLIWCLSNKNYDCHDPKEFWTADIHDVQESINKRKRLTPSVD